MKRLAISNFTEKRCDHVWTVAATSEGQKVVCALCGKFRSPR